MKEEKRLALIWWHTCSIVFSSSFDLVEMLCITAVSFAVPGSDSSTRIHRNLVSLGNTSQALSLISIYEIILTEC